jgi:hypothetical protein
MVELGTPLDHEDKTVATPTPPELDSGTIPHIEPPAPSEQCRLAPDLETAEWLADWLDACGYTNIIVARQPSGDYLVLWQ